MRKLLLLTTTFIIIAITTHAQIAKGAVFLGGNINTTSNKQTYSGNTNEYKQQTINIAPSIGIATTDNQVWGLTINYGHTRTTNSNTPEDYTYNSYGGGVFYRRYVPLGKNFYLFGEANGGYGYSKQHQNFIPTNIDRTIRTDAVYLGAYPGITYAVRNNFHLEVGLNNLLRMEYSNQKTTNIEAGTGNTATNKNFSFNTNASSAGLLTIGFRFILGK